MSRRSSRPTRSRPSIAGRTRRIALLRLIGASARAQRAEVARQGLVVGVIGAFLGLVAGTAVAAAGVWFAGRMLGLGEIDFTLVQAAAADPRRDRRAHHLGGSVGGIAPRARGDAPAGTGRLGRGLPRRRSPHRTGRNVGGDRALRRGRGAAGAGVALGLLSPLGVVVAFVGGILSFTGLALGATLVMPPVLRLVGRLFGRSATARLAAENALRYPERRRAWRSES